jgi:tetratricopeptide (TPR) repeat protein
MNKHKKNAIYRLYDGVRFNTDLRSKSQFLKTLGLLVRSDLKKKSVFKKAAVNFMKIAKKTPDFLDKAYALGWAGRCYEDSGDFIVAAVCYSAAVELAPSDLYALERLGDYFFESKDDSNESEKRFKQILEYAPTCYRTHYKLGKLYSNTGDSDKAVAQYQKSIEVNNGYVASMAEAAIESAKKGDKSNVLKFFHLAMANDLFEFEKLGEAIESCLI